MLSHSRPHIRKRAVLTLYRVCEKYPDVLRQCITRMQEKLDDSDSGQFILVATYILLTFDSQALFLLLSMYYVNLHGETPKITYHWHPNYFTCSPPHPITGCSSRSLNWSAYVSWWPRPSYLWSLSLEPFLLMNHGWSRNSNLR